MSATLPSSIKIYPLVGLKSLHNEAGGAWRLFVVAKTLAGKADHIRRDALREAVLSIGVSKTSYNRWLTTARNYDLFTDVAAKIALEAGNKAMAKELQANYEEVPPTQNGQQWQTYKADIVKVLPQPDDRVTIEFWGTGRKYADLKVVKWKLESANGLAKLDKATQMLAEAKTLDEVKDIMDIEEAARTYARAAKLGFEAANHASEIKMRAERKAGEILKKLERGNGGGNGNNQHGATHSSAERVPSQYREILNDQQIPDTTAFRWQAIASMPELKFEKHIEDTKTNGGELTTSGLIKSFNYKRDTKRSNEQDIYVPQGMDACQTPAYAIDPLVEYLSKFKMIWEPAAGERSLVEAFLDCKFKVTESDIITGKNFFEYEPDKWDCIVTNPPFSIKFQWLARCYALGKPFALLMPVETLGSKTAQELFEKYGVDLMLMDRRVNFKMPNKGWDASGAQFPTAWFTWNLGLPCQINYGKISYE